MTQSLTLVQKPFFNFHRLPLLMRIKLDGMDFVRLSQNQCVSKHSTPIRKESNQAQAFFNVMLKQFGVQGVKVHEVVSLDDEILMCIP